MTTSRLPLGPPAPGEGTVRGGTTPGSGESPRARHNPVAVTARSGIETVGEMVQFIAEIIKNVPTAARLYPAEVVRHAGLLIRANSAVILFMMFMLGAVFGLASHFLFSSIGIESYIAAAHTIGGMRGITEVVFGWIIAAKVGCGIVAEIGAMKISEEIDAMEVMGVQSVPYLLSTRLLAGIVVTPFLWVVSLSVNFWAAYLFNAKMLQTASEGAFQYFLYLFQNTQDFMISVTWGTFLMAMVIVIAGYFGYSAKGGPVGVGRNTAQSMLVNLVMISLTALILVQMFYGQAPNAPIGN